MFRKGQASVEGAKRVRESNSSTKRKGLGMCEFLSLNVNSVKGALKKLPPNPPQNSEYMTES